MPLEREQRALADEVGLKSDLGLSVALCALQRVPAPPSPPLSNEDNSDTYVTELFWGMS